MEATNTKILSLSVHTKNDIYIRFMLTSVFFIAVGITTLFYDDSVFLNKIPIGILEIAAGILGILHCTKVIRHAKFVNNFVSVSILYRVLSYVVDIFFDQFTPIKLNGFFVWMMIWIGFNISRSLVEKAQLALELTNIQLKNFNLEKDHPEDV